MFAAKWWILLLTLFSVLAVVLSAEVPYELVDKQTGKRMDLEKIVTSLRDSVDEVRYQAPRAKSAESGEVHVIFRGFYLQVDLYYHSEREWILMFESPYGAAPRYSHAVVPGYVESYRRTGDFVTLVHRRSHRTVMHQAAADELTAILHAEVVDMSEVVCRRKYVVYGEKAIWWGEGVLSHAKVTVRRGLSYVKGGLKRAWDYVRELV